MSNKPTEDQFHLKNTNSNVGKTKNFHAQFEKEQTESLVNENLILSAFNTVISILTILITTFILVFIKNLDYDPVKITLITYKNTSSLVNEGLKNFIFFDNYILINKTKVDDHFSLEESLLPKNDENLFFAAKYLYLTQSTIFTSCLMIVFLLSTVIQKYSKSNKIVNIIFIINMALFNGAFQIIMYYAIEFFQISVILIFYLIALQIIIKITISKYSSQTLLIFCLCFTANSIFDLILLFTIGNYNIYLANYAAVNLINNLVCMMLYQFKIKKEQKELKMTYNLQYERQSANDLINSMSVGYMKVQSSDIIFNKSVIKIMSIISNEDLSIPDEQSFHLIKRRNSFRNSDYAITRTMRETESKLIERKNKILSLLDDLFKQMKSLNETLPMDIIDLFNEEKIHEFTFSNLYNKILQYDCLAEFTSMGTVDAYLKIGIPRKYQIMVRVSKDEQQNKNVEMLFSDVTEIVEIEKEKAFEKSRSIYLTKIAHEFKNPLSSVMELSKSISASLTNCNNIENSVAEYEEIRNNSEYIDVICKKLCQFIKDYSILNNLKFKCEEQCKLLQCEICYEEAFCGVCKICFKCEQKCNIKIDLNELLQNILKIFEQIKFFEKKDFIDFHINSDFSKVYELKTNYELLYSSIFNIFLFYYKNTTSKSSIDVNLFNTTENSQEYFNLEFKIENLNIDSNFLTLLNKNIKLTNLEQNKQLQNAKDLAESDDDLLIKYFEILIAYQMIKKIGHFEILSLEDKTIFFIRLVKKRTSSSLSVLPEGISSSAFSDSTILNQNSLKINYKDLNFSFQKVEKSEKSLFNGSQKDLRDNNSESETINLKKPQVISLIPMQTNQLNFLIVDDEYLIRRTLIRQLSKLTLDNNSQINLLEASNCFEALEIIYKKIHSDNEKIDAIIVDEYMPYVKGSTFINFIKQISQENKLFTTQIISHTAFDSMEKKQMILNKGADHILNKPVNSSQLKLLIKDLF